MAYFFFKSKSKKLKAKSYKLNRGMTYVELIVVLSIFSIMSAVVLFNYGKFQSKVDINNLANDIALKIVQAQKDAMSGKLPVQTPLVNQWKPSYGIYFDLTTSSSFIYFTDLDNLKSYDSSSCTPPITSESGECLDEIRITKGNKVSELRVFYQDGTSDPKNDLTLTFTRPNSGAIIESGGLLLEDVSYAQITVTSPQTVSARIKLYTSGRVEILQGSDQPFTTPPALPNEPIE
ncbi:type II secretion system GspH family protein [Patescibacteria group bacterium]|nr:type II secretion system GspH family protein [Patescibacteria group bacterium]MBU1727761.1 type II secretion system GspH family protein [Patescibacteria group bacterium]